MTMPSVDKLKIKIFADGADIKAMRDAAANPLIQGFTTNPTLMRQAGINDYKAFALDVLKLIPDRPISFEVFADDIPSMEDQGREIAVFKPYDPKGFTPNASFVMNAMPWKGHVLFTDFNSGLWAAKVQPRETLTP